jgi:hypothetical protein
MYLKSKMRALAEVYVVYYHMIVTKRFEWFTGG